MIWNSNNQVNIRHRLLLTNREVSNFPKAFANNLSDNIKLSKTQLSNTIQSAALPSKILKTELTLMKNVIKTVAKSIVVPLGLTGVVCFGSL